MRKLFFFIILILLCALLVSAENAGSQYRGFIIGGGVFGTAEANATNHTYLITYGVAVNSSSGLDTFVSVPPFPPGTATPIDAEEEPAGGGGGGGGGLLTGDVIEGTEEEQAVAAVEPGNIYLDFYPLYLVSGEEKELQITVINDESRVAGARIFLVNDSASLTTFVSRSLSLLDEDGRLITRFSFPVTISAVGVVPGEYNLVFGVTIPDEKTLYFANKVFVSESVFESFVKKTGNNIMSRLFVLLIFLLLLIGLFVLLRGAFGKRKRKTEKKEEGDFSF